MAEHLAKRLVTALPSSQQSTSQPPSPSTSNADKSDTEAPNLEEWCDYLERLLLATGGREFRGDPAMNSPAVKDAADALHASILAEALAATDVPSPLDLDGTGGQTWEDDSAAHDATRDAVAALVSPGAAATDVADARGHSARNTRPLAGVLRAAGLFLRWHAQVLSSPGAALEAPADSPGHPLARLRSESMVLLYAAMMDADGRAPDPAAPSPDVARFASICLFRATYGSDAAATAARRRFVDAPDGCARLTRALRKGGQPVARLFSIVRNVHHLISACPASIPKMERALQTPAGEGCGEGDGALPPCLAEVLIATLAWAFRSDPPFPGVEATDRRCDLMSEIMRALYALENTGGNPSNKPSRPSKDTMIQIGMILCELLRCSSADERVYQVKLDVVTLLLDATKEYAGFLANNGGIRPLVDILSHQTSLVVVERTASSADDAAAVLPILLALLRLASSHHAALEIVKDEVFPPSTDDAFEDRAAAELRKGQTEGTVRAKNMAPLDAPTGTLRWRLIRLMTHLNSGVKRAACELLWALCDGDSTQFVLRTGFGNAVHFLGIRGCVGMPAGVETP